MHGPFAEHIGVDGTTIWGAATSGKGAVATHLLACMLARIWPPSEAVAIWEQILEERKKELSEWDESEAIPLRSLAIGQIELSREQLAEWDASARAWLRAADAVMKLKQTQLMLMIKNLSLPVDNDSNVYASVMQAWRTAMVTMDKLIDGVSHSVSNGAVLLGLSAWHLYPDLIVLGGPAAAPRQEDHLVAPSGVITIGLQGAGPKDSSGVHWSLSLAHVRYYGDPVRAKGSVSSGISRITFDKIWLVTLGSLISLWGADGVDAKEAAKLVCLIWQSCLEGLDALDNNAFKTAIAEFSWLRPLADAASLFLESSGYEHESCKQLLGLGQRRANLLGQFGSEVPIFGFTDASFMVVLKPEAKIPYLRNVAPKVVVKPTSYS